MILSLQIVIDKEDGSIPEIQSVADIKRHNLKEEMLGLSIAESKIILSKIQQGLVYRQVEQYISTTRTCSECGRFRKNKGHHEIIYRTLFGKLNLRSPRMYKCSCCADNESKKSDSPLANFLTERISPELKFLETKWSSLVSYGMSLNILKDLLPLESNVARIFRNTNKVAKKLDSELGKEKYSYIDSSIMDRAKLPAPSAPFIVGIDGGYVHARSKNKRKNGWFEVIVGKSIQENSDDSKRFGLVCKYDEKPKARLYAMLKNQGFQINQDITFLSDGGDSVKNLQEMISPQAEHLLDWFHITMRITVMKQISKGLFKDKKQDEILEHLDKVKWYVWHGNTRYGLQKIQEILYEIENNTSAKKLYKQLEEFYKYIENNKGLIPNYGDRYRYGEVISTSFVESTVNEVISKRMVKKQQMRWTEFGAHNLLQVRVANLNDDLKGTFAKWYPVMQSQIANPAPVL